MRTMDISTITINTFSMITKGRVDGILRPKSTYYIITNTTTYFMFHEDIHENGDKKQINTSIYHVKMGYVGMGGCSKT